MTIATLFILLFVLMLIGVPVAVALGLSSLVTILFFAQDSLASLSLKLFETSEHYTLLAIPFFILGGTFLTTGGVARRMIRFANACIGHMRGGLAMASVMACMLFAAVSGSSPATVVAVGSIVIAGMQRAGYPLPFAAGVICNAGTLGILIPPSIVMVVYAAATETSVGKLFMAGVIPGIMLGLMLMVAIYLRAHAIKLKTQERATLREVLQSGRDSLWGLLLIVIILGGIYGGVFTPTESAAVACVYAFLVTFFVYRDYKWRDLPHLIHRVVKTVAMVMMLIGFSVGFGYMMALMQIPAKVTMFFLTISENKYVFLLLVNILLLLLGTFMDLAPMLLICTPIFLPVIKTLGIDPVHFGMIMILNLGIGLITPPVGPTLFVGCAVGKVTIEQVSKELWPFYGAMCVALLLVTYIPAISLWLPGLMK